MSSKNVTFVAVIQSLILYIHYVFETHMRKVDFIFIYTSIVFILSFVFICISGLFYVVFALASLAIRIKDVRELSTVIDNVW